MQGNQMTEMCPFILVCHVYCGWRTGDMMWFRTSNSFGLFCILFMEILNEFLECLLYFYKCLKCKVQLYKKNNGGHYSTF